MKRDSFVLGLTSCRWYNSMCLRLYTPGAATHRLVVGGAWLLPAPCSAASVRLVSSTHAITPKPLLIQVFDAAVSRRRREGPFWGHD